MRPASRTLSRAVVAVLLLALLPGRSLGGQRGPAGASSHTFTASMYSGLQEPLVEALLYNPPVVQVEWTWPFTPGTTTRAVTPVLVLYARGLPDGAATVGYRVDAGTSQLLSGAKDVTIGHGGFELAVGQGSVGFQRY